MPDNDSMSNSDILRNEKRSFANVGMPLTETGTGMDTDELPQIIGVLDDFAGNHPDALKKRPPVEKREFTRVSRKNLPDMIAKIEPGLQYDVANTLPNSEEESLRVNLRFNSMQDFGPRRVAEQIPQINEFLLLRDKLIALKQRASAHPEMRKELEAFIEQLHAAAKSK